MSGLLLEIKFGVKCNEIRFKKWRPARQSGTTPTCEFLEKSRMCVSSNNE